MDRSLSGESGGQEGSGCLCPGWKCWLGPASRRRRLGNCLLLPRNGGEPLPLGSDLGSVLPNGSLFPKSLLPGAAKGFSCSARGRLHPAGPPLLFLPSPTRRRAGGSGLFFFFSSFPLFPFFPLSQRPGLTSLPFPLSTAFPAAAVSQPHRPLAMPAAARRPGESGMDQHRRRAKPPRCHRHRPCSSFFKFCNQVYPRPSFWGGFAAFRVIPSPEQWEMLHVLVCWSLPTHQRCG